MSQLLLRLDAQLAALIDPIDRAEIQVQRACYLARIGRFDEAEDIIRSVRKAYGDGTQAAISCWLMLAEGLSEFFRGMTPRALDRIARAQLISVAIKEPTLAAITSAWKAQIDFERSDFVSMSNALRTALSFAKEDDHQARARIALVVSDCLFLCGDRDAAQHWFLKSRSHALEAGDQATIEAMLYNRAACGMAHLRAVRCFGLRDASLISLVKMEVASAKNFQSMTGNAALMSIVEFCEARIWLLNEEFERALLKFESLRGIEPFATSNYSNQLIDLEIIFCLRAIGRNDEAAEAFARIQTIDLRGMDVDDRLVATWTLQSLAAADRRYGDSSALVTALDSAKADYTASRELIRKAIDDALVDVQSA